MDSIRKDFGTARARENAAMDILSDVVLGLRAFDPDAVPENMRQLGYLASLAKGGSYDTDNRLRAFAEMCRSAAPSPGPDVQQTFNPVDAVQKSWGAAWHMDAAKLRRELPLHVARKSQ